MPALPAAFEARMQDQLGPDWAAFAEALKRPPPVSINYNRAKTEAPIYEGSPVLWNRTAQYLPERPSFTLDPHFHAGRYYVQEAGSMFLAYVVEQLRQTQDFSTALDLCGAPGGKTTVLLNALPDDCIVVANEVIKSRYAILRENLAKWGRANVIATHADSERFSPLARRFDLVVVDAPCSGEGLFRKTPDATKEWNPENVAICESRQQNILDHTMPLIAPGGILIYSTCTYNKGENDDQLARILEKGGFETVSFDLPEDWGIMPTGLGYQFYPHRTRSEGFYLAVLRKEGKATNRSSKTPMRYFTKVHKATEQAALSWLAPEAQLSILTTPKGQLYAVPDGALPLLSILSQSLPRLDPGTPVGLMKGKHLIPDHALSLSLHLHPDTPVADLDKDTALDYLRKAALPARPGQKGWHLMRYDGWGIGWGKVLPNRVNNYFPNHLKIKLQSFTTRTVENSAPDLSDKK
jgi:16S rRNA C967 or C1407 C5-methylase (RsmB/RsmF family)/NOL1/NOP2/fmu family ribosome biogenesis protein